MKSNATLLLLDFHVNKERIITKSSIKVLFKTNVKNIGMFASGINVIFVDFVLQYCIYSRLKQTKSE